MSAAQLWHYNQPARKGSDGWKWRKERRRERKEREREAQRYEVLSRGHGEKKIKQGEKKQFCVRESGEAEEVR